MNSFNFCGPSATAAYPFHDVNSMLLDLHHQMAEQYHVYSAGSPAAHTLSVAERLAGRPRCPSPGKRHPKQGFGSSLFKRHLPEPCVTVRQRLFTQKRSNLTEFSYFSDDTVCVFCQSFFWRLGMATSRSSAAAAPPSLCPSCRRWRRPSSRPSTRTSA